MCDALFKHDNPQKQTPNPLEMIFYQQQYLHVLLFAQKCIVKWTNINSN